MVSIHLFRSEMAYALSPANTMKSRQHIHHGMEVGSIDLQLPEKSRRPQMS